MIERLTQSFEFYSLYWSQALDNLEIATSTNSILCWYHLTRLIDHRNELENHHKVQRPEQASRKIFTENEGYGRVSSLALADLMVQAYPDLEKPQRRWREVAYQRKLKSLQNRLSSGRNWHLLQQRFSPGILALVPTSGHYNIQNSEYHKSLKVEALYLLSREIWSLWISCFEYILFS
jgi:hypothetical protein